MQQPGQEASADQAEDRPAQLEQVLATTECEHVHLEAAVAALDAANLLEQVQVASECRYHQLDADDEEQVRAASDYEQLEVEAGPLQWEASGTSTTLARGIGWRWGSTLQLKRPAMRVANRSSGSKSNRPPPGARYLLAFMWGERPLVLEKPRSRTRKVSRCSWRRLVDLGVGEEEDLELRFSSYEKLAIAQIVCKALPFDDDDERAYHTRMMHLRMCPLLHLQIAKFVWAIRRRCLIAESLELVTPD